jgi:hypothetical protein
MLQHGRHRQERKTASRKKYEKEMAQRQDGRHRQDVAPKRGWRWIVEERERRRRRK